MTGSNGTHQDPAVFAARSRVGVEQDNDRALAIYQKGADAGDMSSAIQVAPTSAPRRHGSCRRPK
jgi:hypothetical protein